MWITAFVAVAARTVSVELDARPCFMVVRAVFQLRAVARLVVVTQIRLLWTCTVVVEWAIRSLHCSQHTQQVAMNWIFSPPKGTQISPLNFNNFLGNISLRNPTSIPFIPHLASTFHWQKNTHYTAMHCKLYFFNIHCRHHLRSWRCCELNYYFYCKKWYFHITFRI